MATPFARQKTRPISPISPRSAAAVPETRIFSVVEKISAFPGLMKASDLAEIFGISEDALYRLQKKPRSAIPQFLLPGCSLMLFEPATVVYWMKKHNPILELVQRAS